MDPFQFGGQRSFRYLCAVEAGAAQENFDVIPIFPQGLLILHNTLLQGDFAVMKNINILGGAGRVRILIQNGGTPNKTLGMPICGKHEKDFRFKRTNGHN